MLGRLSLLLVLLSLHAPASAADGLQVELTLKSPAVIEPGADVLVTARLVNTSPITVHVVKPGDGSEVGWREPWVFYEAVRVAPDGSEHEVHPTLMGRCGLFDHDWVKDIVALAPGDSLDLHTWIPDPSRALALDEVGTIRIRMHYAFMLSKGTRTPGYGVGPHALSGVAPFEVVSNPITITVASPLVMRATLRPGADKLRVGRSARLSDLFELAIFNVSDKPVTVKAPGTPTTFRLEPRPESWLRDIELPLPVAKLESVTLAPGESFNLVGPRARFSRTTGSWTPDKEGPLTVQIVFDEHEVGQLARRLVTAPLTFVVGPAR